MEGYVPVSRLKTVIPNNRFGLVIDKKSQTMQVWQDGEKLGEIAVSTGLMAAGKLFREKIRGYGGILYFMGTSDKNTHRGDASYIAE